MTYDRTKWGRDLDTVVQDCAALLARKQNDYGPYNIALAPGGPINGLRVRMFDKLARISNLYESGVDPENEALVDSFMDLANYGIIGVMVLRGMWPGVESECEAEEPGLPASFHRHLLGEVERA